MGKVSSGLKTWRRKQARGAIMSPETFKKIESEETRKLGAERGKRAAGAAYWRTARRKYASSRKR